MEENSEFQNLMENMVKALQISNSINQEIKSILIEIKENILNKEK